MEDEQMLDLIRRANPNCGYISILDTSWWIANAISQGVSVCVHCSDGWDRTAQACSLAALCLEPHYRTINGYQALIEKDWLSFGHKFTARCGHIACLGRERSPVFTQLLDCTWQLLRMHPENIRVHIACLGRERSPVFTQLLDCTWQLLRMHPESPHRVPGSRALTRLHAAAILHAAASAYAPRGIYTNNRTLESTSRAWVASAHPSSRSCYTARGSFCVCTPRVHIACLGRERSPVFTQLLDCTWQLLRMHPEALIEKDWLSFGHKFTARCGHIACLGRERSPVFTQLLDCTWQLLRMHPEAFQFNERFLLTLHDHVHACQYGTTERAPPSISTLKWMACSSITNWSYNAIPQEISPYVLEFKRNMSECLKEVQAADPRPVKRLSPKTDSPVHGECLIACVLKRNGVIEKGKVNKANLLSLVNKFFAKDTKLMKKLDKHVDSCIAMSVRHKDECDLAAKLNACTNDLMSYNKHKITVNY
ncbi:Odorant-binding protein 21, partial [Operophtera brumata]